MSFRLMIATLFVLVRSGEAVVCSSLMEEMCMGCTSEGECMWDKGFCMATNSANCGPIGITSAEDDEYDGCQKEGSFPFYCSKDEAIKVSPFNGSHMHLGLYMPNGDPRMVMDGSYLGDEPECECEPLAGACKESISGDGYNHPFYCDAESAKEISPSDGTHSPSSRPDLFMPNGAAPMIHDGSYTGDAPVCNCTGSSDHMNGGDGHGDHDDHDHDDHDHGDHGDHGDHDHEDHDHQHGDHDDHDHEHTDDSDPSSSTSSSSSSKKSKSNEKVIIIVVVVVLGVLAAVGLLWCFCNKQGSDDGGRKFDKEVIKATPVSTIEEKDENAV